MKLSKPKHKNVDLTTDEQPVILTNEEVVSLLIENLSSTTKIYVSFDGNEFKTIKPNDALSISDVAIEEMFKEITMKADKNNVRAEILYQTPIYYTILQDYFEEWQGWGVLGYGVVSQSNEIAYQSAYSLKKSNYNDPNGGYKNLPLTLSKWILECLIYRPSNYTGGAADRIGLENNNGNGYTFCFNHSNSTMWIDKRTKGLPVRIGEVKTVNQILDEWYKVRFTRTTTGFLSFEIYLDGHLKGKVTCYDFSYKGFSRVVVRGGHEYYVDNLVVKTF